MLTHVGKQIVSIFYKEKFQKEFVDIYVDACG